MSDPYLYYIEQLFDTAFSRPVFFYGTRAIEVAPESPATVWWAGETLLAEYMVDITAWHQQAKARLRALGDHDARFIVFVASQVGSIPVDIIELYGVLEPSLRSA